MKSTRVLIRAKGRGLCIERGLYDCLQRELFADITLNCEGGTKIRANKGVLAAASPVLCHLLRDWPSTEDPCVIMAGYSVEEVQGLIRYIYTGQLSAPSIHGSFMEKIIEDFKVGTPLEHDDDLASIHELTDYGEETSTKNEPEPNGIYYQQPPLMTAPSRVAPVKAVGPKIVAVKGQGPSPRPLILQVQSLTQAQTISQEFEALNDVNDIPNEMTVEEDNHGLYAEAAAVALKQASKRKKSRPPNFAGGLKKSLQPTRPPPALLPVSAISIPTNTVSSSMNKRGKPATSKFARKKYVCPHCNRRFLTRGNVKNHLRTHTKDKPYRCPACQELFAYQGVYQRHLMKHRETNTIDDQELAQYVNDSLQLASEIGEMESRSVRVLNDDDEFEEPPPELGLEVGDEAFEEEEQEGNGEVEGDDEPEVALNLESKSNLAA